MCWNKGQDVFAILYPVLSLSSCSGQCPSIALTQLFVPPNTIFLLFHLISSTERVIPLHPEKPLIIYFCFCPCGMFLKGHRAIVKDRAELQRLLPCLYTDSYLMHVSDCGVCEVMCVFNCLCLHLCMCCVSVCAAEISSSRVAAVCVSQCLRVICVWR